MDRVGVGMTRVGDSRLRGNDGDRVGVGMTRGGDSRLRGNDVGGCGSDGVVGGVGMTIPRGRGYTGGVSYPMVGLLGGRSSAGAEGWI